MKKINSMVAFVTSLIMTAPLVSTAFAGTVNGGNGSVTAYAANAGALAVTQEAVKPKAQAPVKVPAVTTTKAMTTGTTTGTSTPNDNTQVTAAVPEIVETEPAPVSDVAFSMDTVYLDPGETVEVEVLGYTGNLYDEYDGIHDVNLFCLDEDIVRVVKTEGNKFTLEGVSTGFAHVYTDFRTCDGATMRVFVRPLPELCLEHGSAGIEIYPEDYYQIALTGYSEYNDSEPADGTTVTYEFDDPSLVEIINEYDDCIDIIGAASGSTILHATVPDGRTAEIPVTILPNKFRFANPEVECLPGNSSCLMVKGGDAVFSVENDGIIQVISTDSRTLEFSALVPGETTVTATCGDQTITARIIVTDPATTTTTAPPTTIAICWGTTGGTITTTVAVGTETTQEDETDSTTAGTAETTAFAVTTAAAETTAPTGNLPQTGNNDVTGILVIIGTFLLTGAGITIVKYAGSHDSEEQSD